MFEYNNVQNRDRYSVPQRLALPASNVAVGSVFNFDFVTVKKATGAFLSIANLPVYHPNNDN